MSEQTRVTVNLSPMSTEALDYLSTAGSGSTRTDSINKALRFYADIKKLTNEGGALYIREPEATEVERVRIF